MKSRWMTRWIVGSAAFLFCTLNYCARAQSVNDFSAFLGRWQIDLSRTHMNRGNNITRSSSFTFIFSAGNPGLKMDIYSDYPRATPSRSSLILPDHKQRSCETSTGCLTVGGNAAEQSFAYYAIDSHMLMRVFYIKGEVSEYSTYAVSADGNTFTMSAWGAEAPDHQNIQVFEKQIDPASNKTGLYRPHSVDKFMADVDKNHDGLASESEWKAAGLKMDSFLAIQWFNDSISRMRLEHHPFPAEALDGNGDLTMAGMKAYETLLHGFNEIMVHPKSADKMIAELDTNHDGRVSREEWIAGGLNANIFANLSKARNDKGYLITADIVAASFTDYMMDSDGALTVESMKAYDDRRHPNHPDNQR